MCEFSSRVWKLSKDGRVKSAREMDFVKRIFEALRIEDVREQKEDNLRVEGWRKGEDQCPHPIDRLILVDWCL